MTEKAVSTGTLGQNVCSRERGSNQNQNVWSSKSDRISTRMSGLVRVDRIRTRMSALGRVDRIRTIISALGKEDRIRTRMSGLGRVDRIRIRIQGPYYREHLKSLS